MKVAISSTGENPDSNVADVFGRCPYFLIVDINDKKTEGFEAIKNASADQAGGAGISAAQTVAEKDVNAVITGNVGPRALDVFKQFDIEIYTFDGDGTAKEVLQKFIDGKLKKKDI
ncbi:MAG: NifB/NifX family molybdenum-iron cluster-binding protein [archaeon]|nr:NifB/NifX family molybdenum-iron cluster-binding protein [archaeon]